LVGDVWPKCLPAKSAAFHPIYVKEVQLNNTMKVEVFFQ